MLHSMSLIDLLRAPWAILPDRLDEIQSIYAARVRHEEPHLEAIEARLGRKLANEPPKFDIRPGGIAVLQISGPIAPKANLFTEVSGGASAQQLVQQIEAMQESPAVRGAVIGWDSPGGSVQGIPTLERAIRALADAKPTVSVSDGVMASAAYWAGSAANAVYMSGETDTVGSIGVVATHTYDPRGGARQVTEIVAGRYKRMATDTKPLSAEGQAYLQAQVDEIYSVFLETVGRNRGASVEEVLTHMADGRVFIGRQALAAGLVDGIATVEQIVGRMADDPSQYAKRRKASIAALQPSPGTSATAAALPTPATPAPAAGLAPSGGDPVAAAAAPLQPTPGVTMTPVEQAAAFAAEHPEAAQHLRAEGAAAELQRQKDVRAAALPGHEGLIDQLAADGATSGAEAAMAVLAAERNLRTAQAAARRADAPAPLAQEPAPASEITGQQPAAAATTQSVVADAAKVAKLAQQKVAAARAAGRYLSTTEAVAQATAELAA